MLGREHPDTLRSRSSLANTLTQLGNFTEAAILHEETVRDRVRVLGADHIRTEVSRKRLDRVIQSSKTTQRTRYDLE